MAGRRRRDEYERSKAGSVNAGESDVFRGKEEQAR